MKKLIQVKMDIAYARAKIHQRKFYKWKEVFDKNYDKYKELNRKVERE